MNLRQNIIRALAAPAFGRWPVQMLAPGKRLAAIPPLARISAVREKLLGGRSFTILTLAAEFGVSPPEIKRDVAYMRDVLGYEISYNPSRRSFEGQPI